MAVSCEDLRTRLAEAEAALHSRSLGQGVSSMRHGEKSVDYTDIKVADLQLYVARLQRQVDACNGVRSFRRSTLGVIPVDSNGG